MRVLAAEPITTGRLTLVPLSAGRIEEMAAEMTGVLADPDLYSFTGGGPPRREELRARYERWITGSPDPAVSWCNWLIELRDPGCLVGTVQATISTADDEAVAEVAWVVGTPWQGQGIATEAAQAVVGWLRQRPVQMIVARIHPRHQASAAVAAAAGLAPTSEMHDGETLWRRT